MNASAHDGGAPVGFQDLAWLAAQAVFAESGGDVPPHFLAEDAAGKVHHLVTPWSGDDEKTAYLSAVRAYFIEHKVIRYAVISEIWMTQKPIGAQLEAAQLMADRCPDILPSQAPERKSGLLVQTIDHFGLGICFMATIEEGEPRRLSPDRIESNNAQGDMIGGRMAELLRVPGPSVRMHS